MLNREDKDLDSAEITALQNELRGRVTNRHFLVTRMRIRSFTIYVSYKIKRLLDIILSAMALLILSPFLLMIALAIKITSPGPVIFSQTRVGRYGRTFKFYKFRSMRTDAEQLKQSLMAQNQSADGVIFKMKKDPRLTPVGGIIRKTSIDELPQLFNVLIGDMSLVGPRPPVPSEVALYTPEDRKRLDIIPGLTCIWQISGRSDIPFKQQVQLDKEYIASQSVWQDIWILIKTVPAILTGKGAY